MRDSTESAASSDILSGRSFGSELADDQSGEGEKVIYMTFGIQEIKANQLYRRHITNSGSLI